ncbi:MAG: acyltransferase, partial [Planctomycetaceae bacterium]|nr:acyltransferase [Planctomycetaceae bacterium]
ALACLGVFGVHFQQMTGVDADGGPFSLSRLMLNGNTGVCLFFLLSGFLLSLPVWSANPETRNQKLLQGYVRRRTMRILPAYLVCLAALVLVTRHWQTAGERLDVLLHGMLLHNYRDSTFYSINAPFWTVAVQVQFYTVFGMLVSLLVRLRTVSDRVLLLVTGALIPAAWLLHMLLLSEFDGFPSPPNGDGFYGQSPVLTRSLIAHLPIFVLGTMTAWCHVKCSRSSRNCISASAADLLFVGSAFLLLLILATPLDDILQVPGGRYNLPFVPLLLAGMILLVPRSRAVMRCLDVPPLRGIGMISYGIYLFHVPCLKLAAAVLHSGGTSPETAPILFAVSGGLLSIAVASLSWFLLERHLLARAGSSRVGIHSE